MLPRMRNLMIKPHRAGADASGRPPGSLVNRGKPRATKCKSGVIFPRRSLCFCNGRREIHVAN